MSFFTRFRTPLLQNTGSTARDHLASERTYLAWVRTGLGFIALGIAVERFSQLDLEALVKGLQPLPSPSSSASSPSSTSSPDQNNLIKPNTHLSSTTHLHHARNLIDEDNREETEKQDAHNKEQALVGALLGTGSGSIIYGTARYFSNLRLLESGMIKPAYHGAAVLSVTVAGMAGAAYWNTMRHGRLREEKKEREKERERERQRVGREHLHSVSHRR